MLQDIINDRPEQAQAAMHEYFIAKSRELTEGSSSMINESSGGSILTVLGKQPEIYNKSFNCSGKKLTSLKGAPKEVGGDFDCTDNELTSLEGAPSSIAHTFRCAGNNIDNLYNIHKIIKHIGGDADFRNNPINSHILGLFHIGGLERVWLNHKGVQEIVNKCLALKPGSEVDKIDRCRGELIAHNLDDFAKL